MSDGRDREDVPEPDPQEEPAGEPSDGDRTEEGEPPPGERPEVPPGGGLRPMPPG